MLGELIKSKTRLRLLLRFFVSQANSGYLNGLATDLNESTNSIRKELNNLYAAGYINRFKKNNKIEYKVNIDHPLYDVLKKVVYKHLGLEDLVEKVLERMGNVEKIILVGDYAIGIDSGTIEVFLIGKKLNANYISQLETKIEGLIGRKVNFYIGTKFDSKQNNLTLYSNE